MKLSNKEFEPRTKDKMAEINKIGTTNLGILLLTM
tara:strand:+ start:894 stop:998 length:105 start_codon:yes stop_codon:yes gene_type:complete